MNFTFKVKVFSGDGSTLLRSIYLHIPAATEDGRSQVTSYYDYYETGAMAFSIAIGRLRQEPYCKVLLDEASTILSVGPFARYANSAGASNVIDVPRLFSPSPAQGQSLRLVFNNGSYILMTMIQYVDSGFDETVKLKFEYFLSDGTSLGSITTGEISGRYDEPNPCGGFFIFFPMALPNTAGVFTDTFLRCPLGDMNCVPSRMGGTYYNESYTISGSIGTNSYTPARSSTIDLTHFIDGVKPVDTDNPYDGAGTSEEGGGDPDDQNFDGDSDDVEEDAMPSIDARSTGFATLFSPLPAQLEALADIFWGADWFAALQNTIEGIDKMFISLGIVPFEVETSLDAGVKWLGMTITNVRLRVCSKQLYEFDMGTIDMAHDSRIWRSDSAMDYSPFSKLGIYLPFIGFQELDIDEFVGKTVQLIYRIDVLSGACLAIIKVNGNAIYQFSGNCLTQIPFSAQSFEGLLTSSVALAGAAASAGTAAAVAGGGDAITAEKFAAGSVTSAQAAADYSQHAAMVSRAESSLANATANAMVGIKPSYNKSGSLSSSNSLLCVKQPYLYLTTPHQCVPDYYQKFAGFPSNIMDTLSNFRGFTVVSEIRLNNLVATSVEVEEIYELLHRGVII